VRRSRRARSAEPVAGTRSKVNARADAAPRLLPKRMPRTCIQGWLRAHEELDVLGRAAIHAPGSPLALPNRDFNRRCTVILQEIEQGLNSALRHHGGHARLNSGCPEMMKLRIDYARGAKHGCSTFEWLPAWQARITYKRQEISLWL